MADVVLIDAGGANIGSVAYALERLGVRAEFSADGERIRSASHVILPGVGAAGPGMARLHELGLVKLITALRQPVLGVCLGMQLLFEHSEEGDTPCLGVLKGYVSKLQGNDHLRVPHMGWNTLQPLRQHALMTGIDDGQSWAYFVHSYAVTDSVDALASSCFVQPFVAVAARDNFHGAQFHPERSAGAGECLLANFLAL